MRTERKQPQPLATSVVVRGPTHLIEVPQIWYRCPTKQDIWEKVPPIEFEGIKLTDAADPVYFGLQNHDDGVLGYKGVGSSITCRVNVRRTL